MNNKLEILNNYKIVMSKLLEKCNTCDFNEILELAIIHNASFGICHYNRCQTKVFTDLTPYLSTTSKYYLYIYTKGCTLSILLNVNSYKSQDQIHLARVIIEQRIIMADNLIECVKNDTKLEPISITL